jgi:hydrogenase large subunit
MGLLAGRWPHTLALQPGGSTRAVGAAERVRLRSILREFRSFLERRLFGDALEAVAGLAARDDLLAWADGREADFPAFVAAALDLGLDRIGDAGVPFLSYGAYDLFRGGLVQAGAPRAFDPAAIAEDASSAWLADDGPLHPARGETLPLADKAGGYTWCKAPRLAGDACEVGALARQVVAGHPLACDLVSGGASVLGRVTGRMLELARVVPAMEAWVGALQPGEPFCLAAGLPEEGAGAGLVEAARGSLGHWLSIRRGRIERYQIVAPTTWNFSPRDGAGNPGPLERALVGLPAGDGAPPTVQHVVRSFDPCMACTVH